MRLYGIVPYVIGLLQYAGRVTYATLQQELGLDDAALQGWRRELIFQRLAVADEGVGLVWTTEGPRAFPPVGTVPSQPLSPDASRRAAVPPALPPLARAYDAISHAPTAPTPEGSTQVPADVLAATPAQGAPEAARRQVTVLFCDPVASTHLAGALDPEDDLAVVRAFQEAVHAHSYTVACTLYCDAILCQLCHDMPAVCAQAEATITIATAHRSALMQALGPIMHGWASAVQEHSPESLGPIWQGLDRYRSTGATCQQPHFLVLLEEGLAALDRAGDEEDA